MSKLKVNQYVVGPVSTNCYFAVNQESKEAIVIDPGASAEVLMHRMIEEGITVSAILLTHGHFDHAGAAAELAKKCNVPVYAHAQEQDVLESAELNASWMMGLNETYCADVYLKDGQEIDLA